MKSISLRTILCILVVGLCPQLLFSQAPANNNCSNATNLGTLPSPSACPTGNGSAVSTNGTTVNATAGVPYLSILDCGAGTQDMASPALDVWYQFTASGNLLNVTIPSGGLASPNIGLYTGNCSNLTPMGCAIGSASGALSTVFEPLTPGQTYYIQISGNNSSSTGTFTLTLDNDNDCSDCLQQSNLTVSPPPVNGTYGTGQTVTFCYTINSYTQVSSNWLHGVQVSFGPGWNPATLVTNPPDGCSNSGYWAWYPSGITSYNGSTWPAGFYYDYNTASGNPGNNYGDYNAQNCDLQFCWTITTDAVCVAGSSLNISINTSADGESGSWTSVACQNDATTTFAAMSACCSPPTMTSTNVTCLGGTNGSATATVVGVVTPWDYVWTNASGTVLQTTNNSPSTTNTLSSLPIGTYYVTVTDNNGCVSSNSVVITQNPGVTVTVPASYSICANANTTATNFVSTPVGATFTWTNSNPAIGLPASGSGNVPSFTATNTGSTPISGTITVTPTQAGCPGTPSTYTITVNPAPVITIPTPAAICPGQSATITASYTPAPTTTPLTFTNATLIPIAGNGSPEISSVTVSGVSPNPMVSGQIVSACFTLKHEDISELTDLTFTIGTTTYTSDNTPPGGQTYSAALLTLLGTIQGSPDNVATTFCLPSSFLNTLLLNPNATWSFGISDGTNGADKGDILDFEVIVNNTTSYNYTWSPAATLTGSTSGTTTSTSLTVTASPSTTTTYTLSMTDNNNCTSTQTVTVTVAALPPSLVVNNQEICSGATATLTASGCAGTYTWYNVPTGGASLGTGSSFTTPSLTTTTTYYVECSTSGCGRAPVVVTIGDPPVFTALACSTTVQSTNLCVGNTVTLCVDADDLPSNATSVEWMYSTTAGFNPYSAGTSAGTVSVTTNNLSLGQGAPTACPTIGGILINGCTESGSGGSTESSEYFVMINGTSALNVNDIVIDLPNGGTVGVMPDVSSANNSEFQTTINAPGIMPTVGAGYSIIVTDDGNSIPAGAAVVFLLSNAPLDALDFTWLAEEYGTVYLLIPTITATSSVFNNTASESIVISTSTGCSTQTYTYPAPTNNDGTFVSFNGTTATLGSQCLSCSPDLGQIPCLNFTIPAGACNSTIYFKPRIVPTPVAPCVQATLASGYTYNVVCPIVADPADIGYCPGVTVPSFIPSGTPGSGIYYNWSNSNTAIGLAASGTNASSIPSFTATNATTSPINGTITVTPYSYGANGLNNAATGDDCVGTPQTYVITINPLPIVNAGSDLTLTCTTPTAPIGIPAVAGNTYTWSPGTGLSATNIAQPTVSAAGTYTLVMTNTATTCTATDNVVVTLNNTPPTASAGADLTLTCTTPSATIGSAAVVGNTYSWSPSAGLSAANIAQPTVNAAGNYTVTVTNTANGCTASDIVIVSLNNTPPTANAGSDVTLTCTVTSATIGTTAVAGNTYSWSPSIGLSATNIAQPTVNTAGNYTVTVTNTANGCTASDIVIVSLNNTPPTTNAGSDVTLTCTTTSATIGSAAVVGNTYSWSPSTGLSATNIAQPTVNAAGNYTVTVTNTANGCTASDIVIVSLNNTPPTANAGTDVTLTCTTTSATIGSVAVVGNTYSWSPSTGLSATNIAQPTTNTAGNYTVTVTNTANGCTASDIVIVSLNNTPPTANAGTDVTLTCTTTSATIGSVAVVGNTYSWSPSTGLSATNIAQPTASTAGNYTVTVTITANGCTASDIVIVSLNNTPPTANAGSDVTLTCTTTSATIGSAAIVGNTYSWSPSTGLSATNIAQPTVNAAGNYTVTVTNTANGCTVSDIVIVSLNNTPPTANAGTDVTLTCTTTSATIGSAAIVGNTYSWSPSIGLSATNIAQPTVNAAGNYTVTVTNTANGCTASDIVNVSINNTPPTANAGSDVTINCTTTSTTIGSVAIVGNSYSWSPTTGLSASNIAQPTVNAAGNFTVTVTNTSNGCTASDIVIVTNSSALPTANAGSDVTLTCTTTSATIGSAAIVGNTYSWSPSTGLSATNIAQPTANTAGNYTVTVTNTANGCTASDVVIVSLNNTPPTANAGSDVTLTCTTTSSTIGSATVVGNTYSWSPSTGLSATNIAQPTVNAAGNYTVTVTNTANGCTASDLVIVSLNNTPPTANAGSDVTLTCSTTSATIGSAAVVGNTYSWSPSTGLSATNIAQPTVNAAGNYTVTVTNTANGCTASDVVIVSLNNTPPTANAGSDVTLTCTMTSATIGSAAVVGNTYSWSPSTGLSATNIAQPTANTAGNYTVTVTNTANGCTASDIVIVSLNNTPPTANAGSDVTLTCTTTSATIGSAAIVGNTYSWSPSTGLSATNIAQPTVNAAGNYTVTVTNTANGCTASDIVFVSLDNTPPTANAGTDVTLTCTTTSATIGSAAIVGNTYSWSPSTGLSATNIAQPTVNAAGNYTVTVTNTVNGCTATDIVNVTLDNIAPLADAGADVTIDCTTTSATIGTTAVTGNTYSWSPSTGLSATNIAQPSASQAATYTVTVTNTANGCTATDAVLVTNTATLPVADAGTDLTLTCTTPTATIGSASVAGNTYSWSPTTGLDDPLIAAPTVSAAGTYTVTVTITATGCTASDIIIVSMDNTAPLADAGSDLTLTCTTPTATLGTTAVAGNTYSWSPSTGLSATNIAQPTVNTGGSYTVTVTNTTNGCTATDIVNVTLDNIAPLADAGMDISLDCITPTATIGTVSVPGNSYSWSPSTGLSDATIAQPTVYAAGNYTVTVTNTANGCTATDIVIVSLNNTPPTANAGSDVTLTCTTPSATIGATAVAGNTYSWSPSIGLSATNIAQPTVNAAGNYTVTVTNTANGCTASDIVIVSLDNTLPTANAGTDVTLTCTTTSATIGTTAVAGNTYSWSPSTGLSATNIAQPTVNAAGNYTVTVTNTANGCTATDIVNVTVDNIAPLADAGVDVTIDCTTTSATIGTTAVAGNTYSWSPSTGLSATNIAQPSASQAATYTVTVTNTANGCTATDAVLVTNTATLPVADAGTDLTLTCTTPTATIGSASVAGNTYSWSPTTGLDDPLIAAPTVSAAGTYTVTVTITATGCTASDIIIVSMDNTAPLADAGSDLTLTCTTPTATLGTTAVAGNTYSWSPSTGLSATNIAQPTVNTGGSYTVTVTNTTNGCTATDIVNVTLDNIAPLADAGVDISLDCITPTATIGAASVAGNSYSWSPSTGLNVTNIAQPTVNAAGTYTVTVTNTTNGCTSTDDVTVIDLSSTPIADAGADVTLTCTITSAGIGSGAIAGYTYSWSPSLGLDDATLANPTASPIVATTYTVTITETASGCTATDQVNVVLNTTAPDVDAGPDMILNCTTAATTLFGNSTTPGATYSWSTGDLTSTTIAIAGGPYTLTVTDPSNGCTAQDITNVTEDFVAPVSNAGMDQTLTCTTSSVTLDGSSSTTGMSYSWQDAAGNILGTTETYTTSTAGSYTLVVLNPGNGCSSTDVVDVVSNTTAPTADAGADQTLSCTVANVILDGSNSSGGVTHSWTDASGTEIGVNATLAVNTAGDYYLTVTDALNGCTGFDMVTVTDISAPPTADAGADQTLTCFSPFVTMGPAMPDPTMTYSWSGPNGFVDMTSNPSVSTGGTYILTVTNPVNNCSSTDTVEIIENLVAPVANAGSDMTITCGSPTVTLDGSTNITTLVTYFWNGPTGPWGAEDLTTNVPGTYVLTVYDAFTGCSTSDAVDVSIDTIVPVTTIPDFADVCENNGIINLTGATPAGGSYTIDGLAATTIVPSSLSCGTTHSISYTYTNPVNGCSSTSTDNIYIECVPNAMIVGYPDTLCYDGVNVQLLGLPSGGTFNGNNTTSGGLFSPVSIGTDTITYSVVGTLAGCASSTTIMIEVLPAPAPNFTVDNICVYDTLVVQYTGSSEPELEWSFPGSNYATSTSGDGPFLVTYPAGGYHSVTVVATNEGGCSNDTTINIWVSEYEINTISNTTVSWGTPVTLYTNIAPVTNDSATTVLWTPSTYLDCDSCEQPIATPLTPTTYVVTLTDTMGCQFYDTVTIDIDVDYTIYIPNAVTPNGDGENDVWYVYGNRIREVDMRVYNRWGEKVFESEDLNIGWDGVYKGKDVNAGVYVYVVHVTYVDGKDEYFKGNLTVVR